MIQIDIINDELVVHHHTVFNKDGYNPIVLNSVKKKLWQKNYSSVNYNLKNSIKIFKERSTIEQKLMQDLKNRGVL